MENVAAMDQLWAYIQSLSLTANNEAWLGERLIESSKKKAEKEARSFKEIEEDLFNGIPISKEECSTFLSQYRAEEPTTPFTVKEINQRIDQAEEDNRNGNYYSSERVDKVIDALIASTSGK